MNNFSSKIKDLQARINRLKTFGLSSSSSISTVGKTLTIQFTIVPYKVNYEWDRCAGEYSARVRVNWTNSIGLCSGYIKSPANLQNRRIAFDRLTDSSYSTEFGLVIVSGSDDDLDYFNNGGSSISMNITIEIVATADFSLSYTTRKEH